MRHEDESRREDAGDAKHCRKVLPPVRPLADDDLITTLHADLVERVVGFENAPNSRRVDEIRAVADDSRSTERERSC